MYKQKILVHNSNTKLKNSEKICKEKIIMEKKYKSAKSIKARGFFKRNLYYLLTGGAMLAAALVVTLVLTLGGGKKPPAIIPPGGPDPEIPVVVTPVTFVLPVQNGVLAKGYSEHSLVWNPTLKEWAVNMSLDFTAPAGSQVLAAFEGKVESVESTILDGTVIVIAHRDGVKSIYRSLDSEVFVHEGQNVSTGQPIGTVSASQIIKKSLGAHLHFEAELDGETVDPTMFMPDFNDK